VLWEPVSVLHGDGGSGVMTYDVPLCDALLDANLLDLTCQDLELPATVRGAWRSSQTGQIHGMASELPTHFIDNAAPELAAGGHAVNEQNRIT
jgi:hypothetical protein